MEDRRQAGEERDEAEDLNCTEYDRIEACEGNEVEMIQGS